eukprot:XP_019928089.1 PREDICTED: nuclear apoptosis-inducing factor 1-like [Crassostrea gigas]
MEGRWTKCDQNSSLELSAKYDSGGFIINAASITCCRREVDEVKKKWKDARTNVKKKEAMRRKQSTTTGGGPPPEVYFKPWELDVLAMIPEELIHGIEGGVDTGRAHETGTVMI